MSNQNHCFNLRRLLTGLALALPIVGLHGQALSSDSQKAAASERVVISGKTYEWGKMLPEQLEVLRLTGDAERGKEAFRGCRGCHKADAGGIIDGTYPIAGQDNSSQGFRDNFTNIKNNFESAYQEITDLQNKALLASPLTNGIFNNNLKI